MSAVEPITTGRLVLREFGIHDWAALHRYGSDPEVMRGLLLPANSEEDSRDVVQRCMAYRDEEPRTRYELAITLAATGELIGGTGVRTTSARNKEASMGYVLRRDAWGKGYATEAARVMLQIGFEMLEAHRVTGNVDAENKGSIRVLEKLGMRREALFRKGFWSPVHGGWRDTYRYAILEDEWRSGLGSVLG